MPPRSSPTASRPTRPWSALSRWGERSPAELPTSAGRPSETAGRRFEHGFLPGITKVAGGPYDAASDPSVAYDAAHRVWLISSLAHVDPIPLGAAMVVSRSLDGIHWSGPVTIADGRPSGGLDKNWTTCDNHPSSPFFGHCYTEFDDNDQGGPDRDEHLDRRGQDVGGPAGAAGRAIRGCTPSSGSAASRWCSPTAP